MAPNTVPSKRKRDESAPGVPVPPPSSPDMQLASNGQSSEGVVPPAKRARTTMNTPKTTKPTGAAASSQAHAQIAPPAPAPSATSAPTGQGPLLSVSMTEFPDAPDPIQFPHQHAAFAREVRGLKPRLDNDPVSSTSATVPLKIRHVMNDHYYLGYTQKECISRYQAVGGGAGTGAGISKILLDHAMAFYTEKGVVAPWKARGKADRQRLAALGLTEQNFPIVHPAVQLGTPKSQAQAAAQQGVQPGAQSGATALAAQGPTPYTPASGQLAPAQAPKQPRARDSRRAATSTSQRASHGPPALPILDGETNDFFSLMDIDDESDSGSNSDSECESHSEWDLIANREFRRRKVPQHDNLQYHPERPMGNGATTEDHVRAALNVIRNAVEVRLGSSPDKVQGIIRGDALVHYTDAAGDFGIRVGDQRRTITVDAEDGEVVRTFINSISPVPRKTLPTHNLRYNPDDVDKFGIINKDSIIATPIQYTTKRLWKQYFFAKQMKSAHARDMVVDRFCWNYKEWKRTGEEEFNVLTFDILETFNRLDPVEDRPILNFFLDVLKAEGKLTPRDDWLQFSGLIQYFFHYRVWSKERGHLHDKPKQADLCDRYHSHTLGGECYKEIAKDYIPERLADWLYYSVEERLLSQQNASPNSGAKKLLKQIDITPLEDNSSAAVDASNLGNNSHSPRVYKWVLGAAGRQARQKMMDRMQQERLRDLGWYFHAFGNDAWEGYRMLLDQYIEFDQACKYNHGLVDARREIRTILDAIEAGNLNNIDFDRCTWEEVYCLMRKVYREVVDARAERARQAAVGEAAEGLV